MQLASGIQPAQALWLLSLFGALYRRPVDSALLARECVPPLRPDDVQRIGALIGLDAILEQWNLSLERAPLLQNALPLAIEIADKEVAGTDMPGNCEWFVLLQVEESRVVVAQRGLSEPQTLELAALWPRLTGRMLKVRPQALAAEDPEAVHDARGHFGFRWFLPELLKHRVLWQEVLVASVVLQLLALGLPLFTQTIIDKVIVHRTQSTLIALSMGMVVFLVFTAILTWVRQYLILHTGRRVDAVLGSHVFEHLFRLPLRYFHHRPTGVVAARMQGVETIREFISSAAVTLMLELPFLAVFVAIMFWYSVQLTLIVLAILAVIVAASLLVAPLFQSRLNEQFLRGAGIQAFLTEYVSGMETVKSLQLEPQLNRRYRDLLAVFLDSSFRTRQLANAYGTFASTLEQIMSLTVLALGAWIVMEGPSPQPSPETGRVGEALTIGMLVAFQMFASRVSQPMLRLVGLWQQFQQARLAVQRLGDIMNVPTEPYRLARTRTGARAGAVSIEEVSFRYDDNLPLLFDAFSLAVAPGQLIAIMGPSGAGKSTLARLLQGFCVPTAGVIRIDGVDIRCLAANELRSHFGVVPQETTLFSGTILENLQLAAPFASLEQVTAACRLAEVASAIESLPDGYQTQIGERGTGLSGGQRQRLAIARALLKGPRILIFDEATASLDPATAEQLARTINAFKQRTTILFIAHALPKSLQVDRVVRVGEKLMMVQGEAAGGVGPGPDKESPSSIVAEGSAPSPGLGRGLG